nr:hypothetical protein TetV2_00312 [Oceanusvirus sp.]
MLTIHSPHVSNDIVMAAVTMEGTTERLRLKIPDLTVTDKDMNWTRGVAHAPKASWMQEMEAVERALAAALSPWLSVHADSLPDGCESEVKPMARRTKNGLVFFMFRNQKDGDEDGGAYELDDECDFEVELREIRKSSTASGFTAIWRMRDVRVHEEEAAESEPEEPAVEPEETDVEPAVEPEETDVEPAEDPSEEPEEPEEPVDAKLDPVDASLMEEIVEMRKQMDTIMSKISRR